MPEAPTTAKRGRYDFARIEARWRAYWAENEVFRTPGPGDPGFDSSRPKFYILDMFPYPSGAGLHVGHPLGYCATDIIARYKRMTGHQVLHPMGFDAFGLPAEQYAIQTNVHPATTTRENIDNYRRQLQMFGFSYDWSREISTCEPKYYRFTQWIFLQMFNSWYDDQATWRGPDGAEVVGRARPISDLRDELESGRWGVDASLALVRDAGQADRREWPELSEIQRRQVLDNHRLAYIDEVPVNWCPALGTVLANEEVDNDGRSERGGHPVFRRPLRQWMLRITKYADRLLADLDPLDWPEPIKLMQRNWIGRSEGAEVVFPLAGKWSVQSGSLTCTDPAVPADLQAGYERMPHCIRVYTTRPDTLFGATYMVLAPEHPLLAEITTPDQMGSVERYVTEARNRSELERTAETKDKTGVLTGAHAINPVTGAQIPIWVADYVLMTYGTGAIMAVPGSDTRDFEFATKFGLPIVAVVKPSTQWIADRVSEMTSNLGETASRGVEQLRENLPELSGKLDSIARESDDLPTKTRLTLRDQVGLERLVEHYVQHPASWGAAFVEEGTCVNSPPAGESALASVCDLNGLPTAEGKTKITAWLEEQGLGRRAVKYKLRDWLFSRQRYWGEPFPILHGPDGEVVALDEDELPVELPEMEDFKPTAHEESDNSMPEPPLGRAKHWVEVQRDGKTYRRDLNTMPQWAGSCWYYLRFIDPHNEDRFCSPDAEKYWMPVDLYVGGAEHAVLHLLYARFWHKVLFDLGHVSTREPFGKLFNQGMIQGFAFEDERGIMVGPDDVEERGEGEYVSRATGKPVTRKIAKMSKSLRNVVNPDEIIGEYGADTFRLYEMFMGPLDASKPWNTRDVPGLFKLCNRIWRLVVDEFTGDLSAGVTDEDPDEESLRALHKLIKRVGEDVEQMKLNTAIAALFDFVNFLTPQPRRPRKVLEPFVLVLSPFAPHLAEELWQRLGHDQTLAHEPWPQYDEQYVREDEVEVAVQVLGKVRARINVAIDASDDAIREAALGHEAVQRALTGKSIRKVIVVKGRLVNIVAT